MLSYDNKTTTTEMNGFFTDSISIGTPVYATSTNPSMTISSSSNFSDYINLSDYIKEKMEQEKAFKEDCQIIDIVEYVPQKVYKIVFKDKTEIKTIKNAYDDFNPEYMLYLAIAKKLYSKTHTFNGVLLKTYQLMNEKYYVKIVNKGLKLLNTLQEEKKKKEEYDEIKKRKREKNIRKKKTAKERKRQDLINLIAEAIQLSKEGE